MAFGFGLLGSVVKRLGYLTSIPSNIIDVIELKQSKSMLGKLVAGTVKRLVFLPFPILATVDAVTHLAQYGYFKTIKDKSKASSARDLATKNLLGIAMSPLGYIIYPQVVSFYFVKAFPNANIMRSGGGLYSTQAIIARPAHIDEVVKLVKDANEHHTTLMPVGAGFSQGEQFLATKSKIEHKLPTIVSLEEFHDIEVNVEKKTAIIGAGATWAQVQVVINKFKLALRVTQASNPFSVGGSLGTNVHGWDHLAGPLGNTVLSILVVTPTGEIKKLTRADVALESLRFSDLIGTFGLMGIVIAVELQLTDNIELLERAAYVPISETAEHCVEVVKKSPNIILGYTRYSIVPGKLLSEAISEEFTQPKRVANAVESPEYQQEGPIGTRAQRIIFNFMRRFRPLRRMYWWLETKRLMRNSDELLTRNEVMHPAINAMFNDSVSQAEWLQEYFVPEENLEIFIRALADVLNTEKVCLLNASKRDVELDTSTEFGYASSGKKAAVVLCFNQSLRPEEIARTRRWVQRTYDIVTSDEIEGTFYCPYQSFAKLKHMDAGNRGFAKRLVERKRIVDPKGVLTSAFYSKYMAEFEKSETRIPSIFAQIVTDRAKKEEFIGFLKNILQIVDSDKIYALIENILTYTDSHEEIYKEILRRYSEIDPGFFKSKLRQLQSLKDIRRETIQQILYFIPEGTKFDGIVEIGYPWRFEADLKAHFEITGNSGAVYERRSLADVLQAGLPKKKRFFTSLNYNDPDLSSIPTNSAQLITCFVGLHHIPEDKLDNFLADIRRILKPGGIFLLIDHDCADPTMAIAAHSFFNAANGMSWESERDEVRNFRPITYWQAKLAEHGLSAQTPYGPAVTMIRAGDPSRNTMVMFRNGPKPELGITPVAPAVQPIEHRPEAKAANAAKAADEHGSMPMRARSLTDCRAYRRGPTRSIYKSSEDLVVASTGASAAGTTPAAACSARPTR